MKLIKIIGRQPVLEALNAGLPIKRIYLKPGMEGKMIRHLHELIERRGIPVTILKKQDLDQMAAAPGHQGIVAVMKSPPEWSLETLIEKTREQRSAALALLDGIEDPQNLGAILRVAEGTGISGIVLPKRRSVALTPGAIKASAGAAFHLPVAEVTNLVRAMRTLKTRGFWLVGADVQGDRFPWQVDMQGAVGFVLGREGAGLHRLVREQCDYLVKIPMLGKIASLNVATAAAMLFYERVRQTTGAQK